MVMRSSRPILLALLLLTWLASVAGTPDEFEGTYRVGPTTCTVAPVKMAFEVRWLRGRGAMMFFFDGDSPFGPYSYVSERKPTGFDRFVFSDRRLVAGVFIRSDGARFPVVKVTAGRTGADDQR
jgi:hypothetical protein